MEHSSVHYLRVAAEDIPKVRALWVVLHEHRGCTARSLRVLTAGVTIEQPEETRHQLLPI